MGRRNRLEDLTFTFRCQESWADMAGDSAVRHCASCDKQVTNLSALSRAQAQTLLQSAKGKICVRLYKTQDGRVITADSPPVGQPVGRCGAFTPSMLRPRRRALWRRLSTGAAAAAVVLQPGSCESDTTSGDIQEPTPSWPTGFDLDFIPMMGEPMIAPEPPPLPLMGAVAMPLEIAPEEPVRLRQVLIAEELLGDIDLERFIGE
jgi:hypothetical protein